VTPFVEPAVETVEEPSADDVVGVALAEPSSQIVEESRPDVSNVQDSVAFDCILYLLSMKSFS